MYLKESYSANKQQSIYNKDISYDLNEQATNFAEMFGITLNKYTIDKQLFFKLYCRLLS